MTMVEVCREDELDAGERTIVEVKDVEIGVFNIEGEYHALLNYCPHQGGPVCEGDIAPEIEGEFVGPGRPIEEVYTTTHTILCPYHQWCFDIQTGEHTGDRSITIPTYDIVVEDGRVFIEL